VSFRRGIARPRFPRPAVVATEMVHPHTVKKGDRVQLGGSYWGILNMFSTSGGGKLLILEDGSIYRFEVGSAITAIRQSTVSSPPYLTVHMRLVREQRIREQVRKEKLLEKLPKQSKAPAVVTGVIGTDVLTVHMIRGGVTGCNETPGEGNWSPWNRPVTCPGCSGTAWLRS
jgi:hypothetical protein